MRTEPIQLRATITGQVHVQLLIGWKLHICKRAVPPHKLIDAESVEQAKADQCGLRSVLTARDVEDAG